MTATTFANKRPGQRVTFLRPNGLKLQGRVAVQEYKQASGKIVMAFPTHLVVNMGGRYGQPAVVDEGNFVK